MRATLVASILILLAPAAVASPAETTSSHGNPAEEVVGGSVVSTNKWPDVAGIVDNTGETICTGVLVAPNVVLTAGHCAGGITKVILNTNDYTSGGETINVAKEIPYPNWQNSYDVTALVLETSSSVQPRAIVRGCYLSNGASVQIVGYGAIDSAGRNYPTQLYEATTTVTDADCTEVNRGCTASVSPGGELGAGGGGIDTCFGDSGGPLYLATKRGTFVAGLTSRAWDDSTQACGDGGIYERPDAVVDWIQQQTGATVTQPDCNAAPVPTAKEITVASGESATAAIAANDPNTADSESYQVTVQPQHGMAEVAADGTLTYTAAADYVGADQVTVRVTDDGVPPLSGDVVVLVTVTEPAGGCGCSTGTGGSAPGMLLLLGVVVAGLRRRRSHRVAKQPRWLRAR